MLSRKRPSLARALARALIRVALLGGFIWMLHSKDAFVRSAAWIFAAAVLFLPDLIVPITARR